MLRITYTKTILKNVPQGQMFVQEIPNELSRLENSHTVRIDVDHCVAIGPFFIKQGKKPEGLLKKRIVWIVTLD